MRILHITGRADIGGGQEVMYRLIKNTRAHAESFCACPKEEPYWGRFVDSVGESRMCEIPHRRLEITALHKLTAFIRSKNISVIHSHGLAAGIYGRLCGLVTGVPTVHTFHGTIFRWQNPAYTIPRWILEWLLARLTNELIAVGHSEREHLACWLSPNGKRIKTIYNGIKQPIPIPTVSETLPPVVRIAWIGRLHEQKNPLQIVAIVEELKKLRSKEDFSVEVIGTGPLGPALNAAICRAQLSRCIRLAGPLVDVEPVYLNSQILLSTSRWEGLPCVVLEAMSYGLLVVGSRVPGNLDLIRHLDNGLTYDREHPEQAAALIDLALNRELQSEQLRTRAQEFARTEFSLEKFSTGYVTTYKSALAYAARRRTAHSIKKSKSNNGAGTEQN